MAEKIKVEPTVGSTTNPPDGGAAGGSPSAPPPPAPTNPARNGWKKNLAGWVVLAAILGVGLGVGGYLVYDTRDREKDPAEVAAAKGAAEDAAKMVAAEKEKAEAVERAKADALARVEAEAARKAAEDTAREKELKAAALEKEVAALKKKISAAGGDKPSGTPPPDDYAALKASWERAERALSAQASAAMLADVQPLGRHPQDAAADTDRQTVLNRLVPGINVGVGWYWGRLRTSGNLNVKHNVQAPTASHPGIPIHPAPIPTDPGCPGCVAPPPTAQGPAPAAGTTGVTQGVPAPAGGTGQGSVNAGNTPAAAGGAQ